MPNPDEIRQAELHGYTEKDCRCQDMTEYEDSRGYTFRKCVECGRTDMLVANGPDDCEWEEVVRDE